MRREDLTPDCGSCAALCCVAMSFEASEHFAFDKSAGARCPYLSTEDRCTVHARRAELGLRGCISFDCYGAGQRTTRAFSDEDRRIALFPLVRDVHELVWLLVEARRVAPLEMHEELAREVRLLDALAESDALALELPARDRHARALLRRVGDAISRRRTLRVVA